MENSELLLYQSEDGTIKVDVKLQEETVWLTQDQMASLFGKAKSTINENIGNIYMLKGCFKKSPHYRNSEFPNFSKSPISRAVFGICGDTGTAAYAYVHE